MLDWSTAAMPTRGRALTTYSAPASRAANATSCPGVVHGREGSRSSSVRRRASRLHLPALMVGETVGISKEPPSTSIAGASACPGEAWAVRGGALLVSGGWAWSSSGADGRPWSGCVPSLAGTAPPSGGSGGSPGGPGAGASSAPARRFPHSGTTRLHCGHVMGSGWLMAPTSPAGGGSWRRVVLHLWTQRTAHAR